MKKPLPEKKKKQLPRNWIAVAAFQHPGGGKHHTRKYDVSKGSSRKLKHKKKSYEA